LRRGATIVFTGGPSIGVGSYEEANKFHSGHYLQECYLKFDRMQKKCPDGVTMRAGHSKTMVMHFDVALKMVNDDLKVSENITFFIGSFKTYKNVIECFGEGEDEKSNVS